MSVKTIQKNPVYSIVHTMTGMGIDITVMVCADIKHKILREHYGTNLLKSCVSQLV